MPPAAKRRRAAVPEFPPYTVAVRSLCEFTAKTGDLDLRFTPSPSSAQGIAGHKTVAARRSATYRSEASLSGQYRHLLVRGRADGFDAQRALLEEVKTFRGEFTAIPTNHRQLHWAQAKVYGGLLCREFALPELTVSLVYFDVGTEQEHVLTQQCSATELERFFEHLCERFLHWADREIAHRRERDAALTELRFVHPSFRPGQRSLAEAVFRAARGGRCLMAQAPTGIGKTIATIFPVLKACATQELDKVFFLTAKGSGRRLALDALGTIRASVPALPLRVLELVAREKCCEHPDKQCHGASCPLANGFYDRLPQARDAAVAAQATAPLAQQALRDVALAHQVCPYHLGQELVRWCDVVVGDYNHYFDASALLHGLSAQNPWRVAVLVDEAHNLVERARAMYSAGLTRSQLRAIRAGAPESLKQPLTRLHRAWNAATKGQRETYRVHAEPPRALAKALQEAASAIGDHLGEQPTGVNGDLLQFYFNLLKFNRLLDSFGAHSLFDVSLASTPAGRAGPRTESTLCVRNVVPAPFLKPRFAAAHTTVLFSATLTPQHFYTDTLGLPDDTVWLDVDAPFHPEQLSVRIVQGVSTRYAHRSASLAPVADLMAEQFETRPGNYLAFFSSFEYLEQALLAFNARHPAVSTWQQGRRLNQGEREAFLARFTHDSQGIAFAVLGGTFAEGIDLPGARLIGAFIATLGLPPVNTINEEMRRRLHSTFGSGHAYAYLYPGLRKVVQAAGRVIRTPTDRGTVHLIDDRFARPDVLRLLPSWWALGQ